jgi:hypothetical protein
MIMFRRHQTTPPPVVRRRTTTWRPTQLVAGLIGVASLVLGSFAIARTGLNTDHLYTPNVSVATLHHTPLLALSELAFGALMVWAAFRPLLGRGLMALLGLAVLGLGVVTIGNIWPARLHHWLGVSHRNGWLFVLVGGVSFLAALFIPTVRTRHKVIERQAAPVPAVPTDMATPDREEKEAEVGAARRHWWQRRPQPRNTPVQSQEDQVSTPATRD